MTDRTNASTEPEVQSSAMPSPFPPIADYGFLSDCHTGALVAPDGSVDWLCVPRFDSPSVFGSLLDRGAGTFRLAPYGINFPAMREYEAGTNVLITTWKTPSGWVEVRDALTLGPREGEDQLTPHTRPPADDDADHLLVRTALCLDGQVEIELVCEPVFDYGRIPADWTMVDETRRSARGNRGRSDDRAPHRHGARDRRGPGAGETRARTWRAGLLRFVMGRPYPGTRQYGRGQRPNGGHHPLLARLAGAGTDPRSSLACPDPARRACNQGSHLHADRRNGGGVDHLATRDTGR